MNKVILVGRLTKDPEVRYTQTGKVVASFTLAVDKYVGEGKKEADFINIVAWNKVGELIGNNVGKGQKILIDGRIQVRSYDDKQGQKRWVTEVVANAVTILEWRDNKAGKAVSSMSDDGNFGPEIFPDDDVPF